MKQDEGRGAFWQYAHFANKLRPLDLDTFAGYKLALSSKATAEAQQLLSKILAEQTPIVTQCVNGCSPNNQDSEDMKQDGIVGLIKAIRAYDEGRGAFWQYAHFWVHCEVRYRTLLRRRHERIRETTPSTAHEDAHDEIILPKVRAALESLSDRARRIVIGHAVEGGSFREIGKEEGLCHTRARAIYRRSLKKMRPTVF